MVERLNGTLKKAIKKAGASARTWDRWIHFVLHAIRTTTHSATGYSPFELLFGRTPNTPVSSLKASLEEPEPDIPQPIQDYLASLYTTMENAKETAELLEERTKKASKDYQDRKNKAKQSILEPGTNVLCFEPKKQKGLSATWLGPFPILRRLGDLTYLVDMGHGKHLKRHRNALKPYFPDVVDINTVVCLQPDDEALDDLSLGPTTEDSEKPDFDKDIKGIQQLDPTQQQQIMSLIQSYLDTFSSIPGVADIPPFHLDTGQASPVSKRPYRPALAWKPKIVEEIKSLLKDGIIRPSNSPWSSPLMAIPKKTGDIRICIDFRAVNALTTPDNYPLPRTDDLLASASAASFLTTLDLTKGYHQVQLTPKSIPKTAFITFNGKYEYTRLPFWLSNAPAHFQRCMDDTFKDTDAQAYIDDVLVATNTWDEHLALLSQVLSKCRDKKLTLKLKKCCFSSATLDYLGHTIGSGSIIPQHAKIEAVLNFPIPKTRKQVKSFLCLTGYYREHIPHFAHLAKPLDEISGSKSPAKVTWSSQLDQAFNAIKTAFKGAPILAPPDLTLPYTLRTDACATGIGATLSQEKDGKTTTIAFYSKKLSAPEKNYSATELKTLAIVSALKHFSVYLYGSFTNIFTDHKPLLHLDTMVNQNKRLMRWATMLQQYPHKIRHVPGKENTVPDALSRAWDVTLPWVLSQEGGDVGIGSTGSSKSSSASPTTATAAEPD